MKKKEKTSEADVVGAIYTAAIEPTRWGTVFDGLRNIIPGSTAAFFCENEQNRRISFAHDNLNIGENMWSQWSSHYIFLEAGYKKRKALPVGTVTASHQFTPDRDHANSELYNDFGSKCGFFYSGGATVCMEKGRYSVMGIQKPKARGRLSEYELAFIGRLVPHFGRALQIGRMFAQEQAARLAHEQLLENLPQAIVLLDSEGQIAFHNRPAGRVLAHEDGLRATPYGLMSDIPEENITLQTIIQGALATACGRQGTAGGVTVLHRSSGGEPLRILVFPLPVISMSEEFGSSGGAAVIIQDTDQPLQLDTPSLMGLFGFTKAESAVVIALAQGESPENYAERNSKSVLTVRSQVKQAMEKTGTNRQTQLVKTVLTSPALKGVTERN